MNKVTLKLSITGDILTAWLKEGGRIIGRKDLTISQNLDNMLITAIDRLLIKNRMDRLSLKSLKMPEKIRPEAVSGMIIQTIKTALES